MVFLRIRNHSGHHLNNPMGHKLYASDLALIMLG